MLGTATACTALATMSYTPPVSLLLTDEHGAPVSEGYVRYHYKGYLINPVHPVTYVARGSVIARAEARGRLAIPGRIHFRRPFPLSMPPGLFIDHAYVPQLHNAFGPLGEGATSRRGVFMVGDEGERVTVLDVSHDPLQWEASLRYLFDMIRGTLEKTGSTAPGLDGHAETVFHARELIAHFRREYAGFLARFGDTQRERPRLPPAHATTEEERRDWQERLDAALAREPRWGPFLERTWRSRLAQLDKWETSLH